MAWTPGLVDVASRGADPIFAIEDADENKHNVEALAAGGCQIDLGGSSTEGVRSASWVEVPHARHVRINGTKTAGLTRQVTVRYRTNDAGTSVQWRFVNVVDDTDILATGTAIVATTLTLETVAITPVVDGNRYRLEVIGGDADALIFAFGQVEMFDE